VPAIGGSLTSENGLATRQHQVVVLAQPGVLPLDVALTAQLYSCGGVDPAWPYYVQVSALEPGALRLCESFNLTVSRGLEQLSRADTIVVAGGMGPVPASTQVLEALTQASSRGARLVGLGTGVFTLGAAGLLDGRSVTTHWRYTELLQATFPAARVVNALYVEDGALFTSAGFAAAIDLHVELIRRDLGVEAARHIAQVAVAAPLRAGDLVQVVDRPLPADPDTSLAHLRAWMIEHLHEPLPLDLLAARAIMSRRQFTRVFRAETGMSPWQWLLNERLKEARRLLEGTRVPVEQIGFKCGFPTAASFRMHFRRLSGMTPSDYRREFRSGKAVAV
jgi:transcriptional regulator GlxA family with amidase domain